MGVDETTSYKRAVKNKDWRKAMSQEMESFERNNTWKLAKLPPGRKAINLKWVYKLNGMLAGIY